MRHSAWFLDFLPNKTWYHRCLECRRWCTPDTLDSVRQVWQISAGFSISSTLTELLFSSVTQRESDVRCNPKPKTLEMFAVAAVQQGIICETQRYYSFGFTADATTDINACWQFSCCLQFDDTHLTALNVFLGIWSACDKKDISLCLNLPFERPQGYCFGGASNTSWHLNKIR